ncbi:hypothetical protein HPB52_000767 [Rhipicephalus sanguineus]|uniref:Uncharacterized protein n=1 Tax=Rhipicephalus sanguineus TaxID=34632 RepID=A0A9D4PY49_RHISA|nr:hypothetical protein HPB52_000767 [Rhipicephalus sanguineus]
MTSATHQNAVEGAATAPYTLQKSRVPKVFHGFAFKDVEDWLAQFEHFKGWTDADKMRNVYFSLEDGAHTWYENPSFAVSCWQVGPIPIAVNEPREQFSRASKCRMKVP